MKKNTPIFSDHAIRRTVQRNLSPKEVDYVIRYGERIHRAGAVFYYLRDCDLSEADQKDDDLTRLIGTAVVLSKDQKTVLTVWRNRKKGLNHIRRKSKYTHPQWMKQYA
ncbi:MAG: DUF4258 domain-containing protein [Anaerolineales bacterium]|nr:DUF4258 domain-containing protein [Anaerolineales bacterium]